MSSSAATACRWPVRRTLLVGLVALFATALLAGALCLLAWGFFWIAFAWTLVTLAVFAAVFAVVDFFVPYPYE